MALTAILANSEKIAYSFFVAPQEEIPAKVRALEGGAVDFLNKPLVIPEVVARVRMHLKLKHAMESLAEMHADTACAGACAEA